MSAPLVSERIGQFLIDGDRLEYTELGSGDRWVVLLHAQLMTRTMHEPLARVLGAAGMHVVTLDLLGHGRSDRPEDPREYSTSAWAGQVIALLDHLGADRAVVGGTSLGANVALEVAFVDFVEKDGCDTGERRICDEASCKHALGDEADTRARA